MGKTGFIICFLQLFRLVNFSDVLQYLLQSLAFSLDGMTGGKRCKRAIHVSIAVDLCASDSHQ